MVKINNSDATREYVVSILKYDPDSGIFTWKERSDVPAHWNTKHSGKIAGCVTPEGYVIIYINYRAYLAHRIAWLIMTGTFPETILDHKDLNKSNNVWKNLRSANNSQNGHNRPKYRNNKSGYKGVCWSKVHKKWRAQYTFNGRCHRIGLFDNPQEAHDEYVKKVRAIHKEYTRVA